jgi:3-deoxy-D-manno-octulosonic acid kinase
MDVNPAHSIMPNKTKIKINRSIFQKESSDYFEPKYWQSMHAIEGHERGRGTTWFVRHRNHSLVLRHYYRGGLMSRINRDSYVYMGTKNTRSFKEFSVLKALFDAGLPVPEPAAARVVRKGRSYTADLITRRIPNAQDLLQVFQAPATSTIIRDIAETVAQLHDFGVWHPDLNIQNILIDNKQKVWIIDFDQAKILPLKPRHRMRMLERLERSFMKEHVRHGIIWTDQNWRDFMHFYTQSLSHK